MAVVPKYWSGSAWVAKPVKYWNGSSWVAKTVRYWTGSQWLPAGAAPPGILDGLSATAAFSMSRDLLSAFAGSSRYTSSGGTQLTWKNQTPTGSTLDIKGGTTTSPSVGTANGRTVIVGGTSGKVMVSTAASSNYITASTGYCVCSYVLDAGNTNASGTPYDNHSLFGDTGLYWGAYIKNTNVVDVYSYSSVEKVATLPGMTVGQAYVLEWKHESGVLSGRLNGGSWVNVSAGNTDDIAGTLGLIQVSSQVFYGKLFELVTFNAIPSTATQNALVADMMSWCGATTPIYSFGDVVQTSSGAADGPSSFTATLPKAITAGNIVLVTVAANNVPSGANTGWTKSTQMNPVANMQAIHWWFKAVGGDTIPTVTFASATQYAYVISEYAGPFDSSPYSTSTSNIANESFSTIVTPSTTPTAGTAVLMVAGLCGQAADVAWDIPSVTLGSFTNSFTNAQQRFRRDMPEAQIACQVSRVVTSASGSYNTTGTASAATGSSGSCRSGLIIVFKKAP